MSFRVLGFSTMTSGLGVSNCNPSLDAADDRTEENYLGGGRGLPGQPYEFVTPHLPAIVIGDEKRRFGDFGLQAIYRPSFTGKDGRISQAQVPRK